MPTQLPFYLILYKHNDDTIKYHLAKQMAGENGVTKVRLPTSIQFDSTIKYLGDTWSPPGGKSLIDYAASEAASPSGPDGSPAIRGPILPREVAAVSLADNVDERAPTNASFCCNPAGGGGGRKRRKSTKKRKPNKKRKSSKFRKTKKRKLRKNTKRRR